MDQPSLASIGSICESCGLPAPTKYVEFYENVGALVMRFHRSVKGNLCKPCIDRWFWNLTGKSFLLGWWGIVSFILTPFILLNNFLRYITTLGMPRPPIQMSRGPSPFWVFSTIAGAVLALLFVVSFVLSFAGPAPPLWFLRKNAPCSYRATTRSSS